MVDAKQAFHSLMAHFLITLQLCHIAQVWHFIFVSSFFVFKKVTCRVNTSDITAGISTGFFSLLHTHILQSCVLHSLYLVDNIVNSEIFTNQKVPS